jgi:hypothetical protein
MTHHPLPLPPPPDHEFDDSEPTAFDRQMIERRMDVLSRRIAEAEGGWEQQLGAVVAEQRETGREVKEIKETLGSLVDEMRKFMKFALEIRGDQFALADRVSNLEQPRTTRGKRK